MGWAGVYRTMGPSKYSDEYLVVNSVRLYIN